MRANIAASAQTPCHHCRGRAAAARGARGAARLAVAGARDRRADRRRHRDAARARSACARRAVPRHPDARAYRSRSSQAGKRPLPYRVRDGLRPAHPCRVRAGSRGLRAQARQCGAARHDRRTPQGAHRPAGAGDRGAAARARRAAARLPGLDQRVAGADGAHHHGRGRLLLPGRQQIHARGDRRRRIADQEADQGALARARPRVVLADPPLHHRQRACHRRRSARSARPHAGAAQAPRGAARGERRIHAAFPADVAMQRLLNGLSWSALALVAAFCALQALEWVLAPASGVVGGGIGDMALGWLSRMTVFLVTGVTMLVTALVVLNAAGRAGRDNFGVAVLAAIAGAGVSALVRYAIGATPSGEGAAYMLLVFTSWLGSGAILVAGYVFYLRAQATETEARGARCSPSSPATCAERCRACARTRPRWPRRSISYRPI